MKDFLNLKPTSHQVLI